MTIQTKPNYLHKGVEIVVNSSVGSAGVPFAPAVAMAAAVGISVQMLATPQYTVPSGFTYWD